MAVLLLIVSVSGLGTKLVLFGFSDDFTSLCTLHFKFVQGVLAQNPILELHYSLHIERVTLDFTLCLIIVALVPIVFWPAWTTTPIGPGGRVTSFLRGICRLVTMSLTFSGLGPFAPFLVVGAGQVESTSRDDGISTN